MSSNAISPPPPLPGFVLAMTGATGSPYAVALLHALSRPGRTVHRFIVSRICDQLGVDLPARRWGESPATGTCGAS
jgi:3-polyprenyl-4-hydroxybenzoate decarboxylase